MDAAGLRCAARALDRMDEVFGIFYAVPTPGGGASAAADAGDASDGDAPPEIMDLVAQRAAAKAARDWATADALRDEATARGYALRDGKGGCQVTRL